MLASLALVFTREAESSEILTPAQQEQVADGLEENAEVMTNTELERLLEGQPLDVQDEILRINEDARPVALQDRAARAARRRAARPPGRLRDDAAPRPGAVGGRRDAAGGLSRRSFPEGSHVGPAEHDAQMGERCRRDGRLHAAAR